jgi:hypothetical protein
MTIKNSYSELNHESENELVSFINNLTPEQLTTSMPAGWDVISVLAHVVFWDIRALTLINKWEKEGIHVSEVDTDVINEVTRPIFLSLEPASAVAMIAAYSKLIDEKIDGLTPEFIESIEIQGKNVHLNRAKHRRMHIEEIKQVLHLA